MSLLSRSARKSGRPRSRSCRLLLERVEERALPSSFIAVGTEAGTVATVRIYTDTNGDGTYDRRCPTFTNVQPEFTPYGAFGGGVRVALGDFDGDGNDELVTGAGPAGGPHVIVWDLGADGSVGAALDSFFAYGVSFTGGVFVAAGDLDSDG